MASISSVKPSLVNLSPLEFTQLSHPPLLIDVRSQLEYVTGHAPDAINLSLPRILMARISGIRNWILPQWFRELSKDKPIAVICLTSHRSPIAGDFLIKLGFAQVFNITGGMVEWQKLNLETVKYKL